LIFQKNLLTPTFFFDKFIFVYYIKITPK